MARWLELLSRSLVRLLLRHLLTRHLCPPIAITRTKQREQGKQAHEEWLGGTEAHHSGRHSERERHRASEKSERPDTGTESGLLQLVPIAYPPWDNPIYLYEIHRTFRHVTSHHLPLGQR